MPARLIERIVREHPLDEKFSEPPILFTDEAAISVMTLAELRIGVPVANDVDERARRMEALSAVERTMRALPVDEGVASAYARLAVSALERGVRPKIIDCLIAATAAVHGVPVYTRDSDFDELAGVEVVRV